MSVVNIDNSVHVIELETIAEELPVGVIEFGFYTFDFKVKPSRFYRIVKRSYALTVCTAPHLCCGKYKQVLIVWQCDCFCTVCIDLVFEEK